MSERTIADEIGERLELRGITPEQALVDPLVELEYCQIVTEVCDDLIAQKIVYGSMSNGGEFTGLLNSPGAEIDRTEPGFRRHYLGDWTIASETDDGA